MRLIKSDPESKDRRRRIHLYSKRLEEIAAARRELVLQVEILDTQRRLVRRERNALRNVDAPISILPDDVLAMIFEEGMHPRESRPQSALFHFGVLVSHVTQHWRNVSITTPKLWTSIFCNTRGHYPLYPEGRDATFLSRARLFPLNIYLEGFRDKDFSSNFLQLLSDHIGHCRHLRINAEGRGLTRALKCISSQPMPLLQSIDLECSDNRVEFHEQFFPSGVPCLTTAHLDYLDVESMHHCLPAFASLISLQLTGICLPEYNSFRDGLMALSSLRHLDLQVELFNLPSPPTHLPILLPTILHLRASDGHKTPPHSLGDLLACIQAPSLIALSISITRFTAEQPITFNTRAFESHLPSLKHLVLTHAVKREGDLAVFARSFPNIRRLTCADSLLGIDRILDAIFDGTSVGIISVDAIIKAPSGILWPKLQCIASEMPTEYRPKKYLDFQRLKRSIFELHAAGHPIRKLLLPRTSYNFKLEMCGTFEIEDYYLDWPTPFDWPMPVN